MTRTSMSETMVIWMRSNVQRMAGMAGLHHGAYARQSERLPAVLWTLVIGAVGILTFVLTAAGAPAVVRAPFVLGYLLVAPGWAIARQMEIPDSALRISIALALSVSIVGLLTIIQAYASTWSPTTVVLLTVLITLTAACIEIVRERRGAGE